MQYQNHCTVCILKYIIFNISKIIEDDELLQGDKGFTDPDPSISTTTTPTRIRK